jgi:hypothetical protein
VKAAVKLDDPMAKPALKKRLLMLKSVQDELCDIGFVLPGSIVKRFMRCGREGCSCQTDPKAVHGPYYDWSRKVNGKTVSTRLTEKEATLLIKWIDDKNRLYGLVTKMERIGLEAVKLIRE